MAAKQNTNTGKVLTVAGKAKRKGRTRSAAVIEREAIVAAAWADAEPITVQDGEGKVLAHYAKAVQVTGDVFGLADASLAPTLNAWAKANGIAASVRQVSVTADDGSVVTMRFLASA